MSKPLHVAQAGFCFIIRTSFSTSSFYLKKITAENVLKKYNRENKLLFGPLLETQAQKQKRLKRSLPPPAEKNLSKNKCSDKNHTKDYSSAKGPSSPAKNDATEINFYTKPGLENLTLLDLLKVDFPLENPHKKCNAGTDQLESNFYGHKPVNKTEIYLPSVTQILSATMSPVARRVLDKWRSNKIVELGWAGFIEMNNASMSKGKAFHMAITVKLMDININASTPADDLPEEISNCLKSAEHVLKQITKVHAVEASVQHDILQYRGFVDCICDFGNKTHVTIEWKKSDRKKLSVEKTYDAPIQAAAYMGALNYDERYPYVASSGMIVVVYEDGSPANVFPVEPRHWKDWYKRYQAFAKMNLEG